jgi:hypothetical protein
MTKRQFTIVRKQEVVEIDGKDYTVKEATSLAVERYKDLVTSMLRFNADGSPSGMAGSPQHGRTRLLSLCVFEGEAAVTKDRLDEWPDYVVDALFDMVKAMTPSLQDAKTEDDQKKAAEEQQEEAKN